MFLTKPWFYCKIDLAIEACGGGGVATVKSFNKVTNTTYIYDSHKVWSKSEKKYKTVRKLIGKIDPATGLIVPTGPRGRPSTKPQVQSPEAAPSGAANARDVQALAATIAELRIENSLLKTERESVAELLDGIIDLAQQARDLLRSAEAKPDQ